MRKALYFVPFLLVILLAYQNCGDRRLFDPNGTIFTSCDANMISFEPKIYLNNALINPTISPSGQRNISKYLWTGSTVNLRGYDYSKTSECGNSSGANYWILPNGSRVNDYCASLGVLPAGKYSLTFSREGSTSNCHGSNPNPVSVYVNISVCMPPPCAAPPPNCTYDSSKATLDENGCPIGCGELKCTPGI